MELLIDNRQDKIDITEEMSQIIERTIEESLRIEGRSLNYEISVSFVDDNEIQALNKEFRGVDRPTDVLSFPLEEEETEGFYIPLLGDIVISIETALRQSIDYGHPLLREIVYLTAHSMFHLLGYDHMMEDEKALMREKEKKVMKVLGIYKQ